MSVYTFRSPVTKPLKRHDEPPFIACGQPGSRDFFRVTQRFGDPDFYWRDIDPAKAALGHRATDIGDCGPFSTLVAMAPGRVTHLVDDATRYGAPNNAICSRLDVGPGSGIVIDYWHCASHLVPNGAIVMAGTPVAAVGNTGLGQVYHCHITVTVNGQLIDPERIIFGGSIDTGGVAAQEDTSMLDKAAVNALYGRTLTTLAGANVRRAPATNVGTIHSFPAGAKLVAVGVVTGQFVANERPGNQWFAVWIEEHDKTIVGFVHDSAVFIDPADEAAAATAPPPAGPTAEELRDIKRDAFLAGRDAAALAAAHVQP